MILGLDPTKERQEHRIPGAEDSQSLVATCLAAAGQSMHFGRHELGGNAGIFLGTICDRVGLALLLTGDFWNVLQLLGS